MGTSTDELRRIVADSDLETRPDSLLPDDYLDRAEQQAEADTQPAPGQDDRPSQVAAFNTIEEIAPALTGPPTACVHCR